MREEIQHKETIDKKMHPHISTTALYQKHQSATTDEQPVAMSATVIDSLDLNMWTKVDPGFSGDAGLDLSAPPCPTHLVCLHRSYGWRRKV